ncbi:MAG: hypothetical protein N3E37_02025, partial [Candidatus Micrarchaeota archaeon]|nr:hypothetical protein [Candidatus Micrarchaeota archaeon]
MVTEKDSNSGEEFDKKLDLSKTILVKGKPLSIRGSVKEGLVVSAKAKNTAIVQRDYFIYNHKFK